MFYTHGTDGLLHCSPIAPAGGVPDFKVTMRAKEMKPRKVRLVRVVKKRKGPPQIGLGSSDNINYRTILCKVETEAEKASVLTKGGK